VASASNPCTSSFITQLVSGNAIVCNFTFEASQAQDEVDQIQTVVDNAVSNYGSDSPTATAAETAALQQQAQASDDVTSIDTDIANSSVDQVFTTCDDGNAGLQIPGLPCIDWTYLLIGIGLLVVLYFAAVFSSLIPRRG
jgi:hypothetical protein